MKHRVFRSIVIGVALGALTFAFVPTLFAAQSGIGKEKVSAYQPHVSNGLLRCLVGEGAAEDTYFAAPTGIDYGDVITGCILVDTNLGAITMTAITLDSLYWQNQTDDSLASGIAIAAGWVIWFYYDLTD